MPSITKTITVELEVTVSCIFDRPDPSVGIFESTMEDFTIDSITGITPVIQVMNGRSLDKTNSIDGKLNLQSWNQISAELEEVIKAEVMDDLYEADAE